ncbi:hypothetical protein [Rhodovulum sp.]|uniref:hypothetical protein n=1 Tax=Rhodovulum sp. TaxID=34009 RepID=UPI00257A1EC6|nr:hypothetical protein [Rhodovulum sp.]
MDQDTVAPGASRIRAILVIDDHPLYSDALAMALRHVFDDRKIRSATSLGEGLA